MFVIDIAWPSGGFVALICCHCGGFMVVYGGIMVVCSVGFGSILVGVWLTVGCVVTHGGLQGGSWWVCGVAHGGGSHFWSIPVVLGVGFFCCFVLHCSKHTV